MDYDISLRWGEADGLFLELSEDDFDDDPSLFPVEELVEEVMAEGRATGDFQMLYCIAHELTRLGEEVRSIALQMDTDENTLVEYYGIDREDLE